MIKIQFKGLPTDKMKTEKSFFTTYFLFFILFLAQMCSSEKHLQLPIPENQICFRNTQSTYMPINKDVLSNIFEKYDLLEKLNKTLFNTAILKNPETARVILESLPMELGTGKRGSIALKGDSTKKVPFTYFDRGSNELVVIGGGFANPREMLAPLTSIFADYDVVIVDHIGHGLDYTPSSLPGWLFKLMLNIDFTALKGGKQEEAELLSITDYFKSKKEYKNLYGVGFCYATGIFIKTAANNPGLFKKLILDGAWESAQALMKRFAQKPELFFDPQRGDPNERLMRWGTYTQYQLYMYLAQSGIGQRYLRGYAANQERNREALEKLTDTPILYFHGSNDLVISSKQFNNVWDYKPGEKAAIITDGRHLQNYIKYKQLFCWATNCFLDLDLEHLEYSLQSIENLNRTHMTLINIKKNKQPTKPLAA